MKKRIVFIFTLFLTVLLQVSCVSDGGEEKLEKTEKPSICNCSDVFLDPEYGHFFIEKRDEPFNGACESYYPDGSIEAKKIYENGRLEGPYIEYHENGEVKSDWNFLKGRQHGDFKGYNNNGELLYHSIFYKGDQDSIVYP